MKFFISDTHFGHANIIKYCHRPYSNVESMNEDIVRNWNSSVTCRDEVYFLGDLCLSDFEYWWSRLNGNKILIRGNHDTKIPSYVSCYDRLTMCIENTFFCLVHAPNSISFNGWIIHGHHHNYYPLISPRHRLINVSVETTGYRPMCLNNIMSLIRNANKENTNVSKWKTSYQKLKDS